MIDYRLFPKIMIWFYNGWVYTGAGLILLIITYSSSIEIQGATMHEFEFAIPVVHIAEVVVILWVTNKMIKYDLRTRKVVEGFIELSHFPSTVDGSI